MASQKRIIRDEGWKPPKRGRGARRILDMPAVLQNVMKNTATSGGTTRSTRGAILSKLQNREDRSPRPAGDKDRYNTIVQANHRKRNYPQESRTTHVPELDLAAIRREGQKDAVVKERWDPGEIVLVKTKTHITFEWELTDRERSRKLKFDDPSRFVDEDTRMVVVGMSDVRPHFVEVLAPQGLCLITAQRLFRASLVDDPTAPNTNRLLIRENERQEREQKKKIRRERARIRKEEIRRAKHQAAIAGEQTENI